MSPVLRSSLALMLITLLFAGCSESENNEPRSTPLLSVFEGDPDRPGSAATRNDYAASELPVITSASFEPKRPVAGERLRVVPRVDGGTTSIQFEWRLNGIPFGPNAAEISVPALSAGDEVSVWMTPFRGVIEGRSIEVSQHAKNQRPIVAGLQLERVEDGGDDEGAGEYWRAVVEVGDPDDESVSIEYRWFVNGSPLEDDDEDTIRVEDLVRGDTIAVHVRATDGEVWSAVAKSGEIAIGNTPPDIHSNPPSLEADGSFRYIIRAADRDPGDQLEYALRTAPRGMRVNTSDGIVTWIPDEEQAGRHEVELVVSDGKGGEAVQSFVLALVANSSAPPAALR